MRTQQQHQIANARSREDSVLRAADSAYASPFDEDVCNNAAATRQAGIPCKHAGGHAGEEAACNTAPPTTRAHVSQPSPAQQASATGSTWAHKFKLGSKKLANRAAVLGHRMDETVWGFGFRVGVWGWGLRVSSAWAEDVRARRWRPRIWGLGFHVGGFCEHANSGDGARMRCEVEERLLLACCLAQVWQPTGVSWCSCVHALRQ